MSSLLCEIAPALAGLDPADQSLVDGTMRDLDGTPNLGRLGANAVLAASVACALAEASSRSLPFWRLLCPDLPPLLPLPMVNVISGGAHAGGLVDVQDFLVVPVGAHTFTEAIEWAARVRAATAAVLRERGHQVSLVADEGGLAAPLAARIEPRSTSCSRASSKAGSSPASMLRSRWTWRRRSSWRGATTCSPARTGGFGAASFSTRSLPLVSNYPIVSVEDPLGEDDESGWREATALLGGRTQLLGDDVFVTSPRRVADGIRDGVANAVLVKPNQVGTPDGRENGRRPGPGRGVCHRALRPLGETEDSWLADLAVGWRTGQLKVGSTTRSERNTKWNRLLLIESQHPQAEFAREGGPGAVGGTSGLRPGGEKKMIHRPASCR